jgi:hypothetical protein
LSIEARSKTCKPPKKLKKLGELAKGDAPLVPINNTCTVFTETEIISLVARGERAESILKGVFSAIASHVAGIASRSSVQGDVFFSGGVGKNYGVVSALEMVLECPVYVPDFDPQLVRALGAAMLARDLVSRGKDVLQNNAENSRSAGAATGRAGRRSRRRPESSWLDRLQRARGADLWMRAYAHYAGNLLGYDDRAASHIDGYAQITARLQAKRCQRCAVRKKSSRTKIARIRFDIMPSVHPGDHDAHAEPGIDNA